MSGMGASGDMGMTRTAAIVGSPFYMSPEQMHSARSVDPRTDLWSLGVILYELLTDRVPFEAEAMPELVIKVLRETPAPLSALRADVPPGLGAIVLRCLEKDRERRYADIGQLVRALVDFGPARARLSLEVVDGIVHASAAHKGAFSLQAPASERVAVAPARAPTVASWGGTGAGTGRVAATTSRPWRRVGAVTGAVTLVLASAGAAVALWSGPRSGAGDGGRPLDPSREHDAEMPVIADASADAPSPLEAGADPAEASTPAAHDGGWHWPPPPRDAGAPPPPPPPPPPTDCRPPYFYDADGNKVFKLGCL